MSDMQVQVELKVKDALSKPAATALDSLGKSAQKAGTATDAIGKGSGVQKINRDATDAARSMDAVGREARTVEQRIKGAEQSAVAFRRTLKGVQSIARDAASHMAKMGKGLTAVGTGAVAAGYVAKSAMEKPVDFEGQSLDASNVIYKDLDVTSRIGKAKELRKSAYAAARKHGGSADQAMTIIQGLAAGDMNGDDIDKLLPVALKTMVAAKLNATDVTAMMVKGIKNKMFTVETAGLAMDEGLLAGKAGGFEFKDMARWMPQVAPTGAGMKNHEGYLSHLSNLQAVEVVSASADQAGNNYVNLLAKLSSPDVKQNFKNKGVNLEKVQLDAIAKGTDPITAMANSIDAIMAKNKKYKNLQKQLAQTDDNEKKRDIAEQMVDVMQGGMLGKLMPDKQAQLALIGITSQKQYRDDVRKQLQNAQGTVDKDHAVVASGTGFKAQQVATEGNAAQSAVLDTIKTPLDATLERATQFAQQNPLATTAMAGMSTAGTMAAAGGATVSLLQGGSAASGALRAAEATARGTSRVAPLLSLGMSAYDIYSTENDASLTRNEKNINNMETYGGFGGALAGAAMGGAAGSVVPVIGNVAGALLGAIAGYFSGGMAGKATGQMIWDEPATAEQPPPAPPLPVEQTINQTITLELDGEVVARKMEKYQSRESLRR